MRFAPALTSSRRFASGLRALAALVLVTGGGAGRPAFADTLEDAVNGLASSSGEKISASVKQLATLDDARAIPALDALCDDRLLAGADGRAWIFDSHSHDLKDPVTGAPAPAGARPAKEVALDNDIRREAQPVLAQLQLASPDKSVRLAAAEELSKAGSDDAAVMLHKAYDKEKDKGVHEALALAVARLDLQSKDAATRLAAVQIIHKSGNDAMLGELQRLVSVGADGKPQEPDELVRGEAKEALEAVMSRRKMVTAVGSVIYGVSLASVLLFAALGLAITVGLLGVVNMAHGEMLKLGAYAHYAVQTYFKDHLAGA